MLSGKSDSRIYGLIIIALLTVVLVAPTLLVKTSQADSPKIVYVAICIDSEMWGGHGPYVGSADPHPTMDMRAYSRTSPANVAAVMDSNFRESHKDSFGNIFKISWFAEMDYLMAQSNFVWGDGSPAGVSGYTAIHDILMNNWGTEIQMYGDSIEYHHHFMIYSGTWQRYDNGPDAGYPEYQMYALDQMIIDRNFYPTAFRSGWLIMPSALSNWLEQWIPFDYTPSSGIWYPWHPSGMSRWQTTCAGGVSQSDVNAAFARARDYGSAIYAFYCHDREDMHSYINTLQSYLNAADADEITYPNVSFKYVSAREAMQLALGYTDFTPPTFTVARTDGTYTITSNEALWKDHPYVALKYADGTYIHPTATKVGTNTWTITPPTQLVTEENVAVRARETGGLPIAAATASSYMLGHEPSKAIDGDDTTNSYWDSTPGTVPQWLKLDLGSTQTFGNIRTHFYDGDSRTYKYKIEISTDDITYTEVVPEKQVGGGVGKGVSWDYFSPAISARYIKITVTYNSANNYAHIIEVKVGVEPPSITASTYDNGFTPDKAIDGIESTSNYWGTHSMYGLPQWLKVDLRSPVAISKITTHFYDGDARTYTYYIEASLDDSSYTTIVPLKTASSIVTDTFPEGTYRYVRITVTDCSTSWKAAHIEEIKIYHVTTTALPPLEKIGVAASDLYGNPGVLVVNATRNLTIAVSGHGTTNPSPGVYVLDEGSQQTVTAVPDAGYKLDYWDLDGANVGSSLSYTVTMDEDHTLTAVFVPAAVYVHDVAIISISVNSTMVLPADTGRIVQVGDVIQINVTAKNEGNTTESFAVNVIVSKYDDTEVGMLPSQEVVDLAPNDTILLTFYWDTDGMNAGGYIIRAIASAVPGENYFDTYDNTKAIIVTVAEHIPLIPTVKVVPAYKEWLVRGNFTLNVTIENLDQFWDMGGFSILITYNSSIINAIHVTEGPFLASFGDTFMFSEINNDVGYVLVVVTQLPPRSTTYGSGRLFTVEFTGVNVGECDIKLEDIELAAWPDNSKWVVVTSVMIPSTTFDGYVKIMEPLPGDINADGEVGLADLVILASAYGSRPGDPKWNPYADIAEPWGVVSLSDLVTVALYYGQHFP